MPIKNKLLLLTLRNLNSGLLKAKEWKLQNNKRNGRPGGVPSEEQHGWEQRFVFGKETVSFGRGKLQRPIEYQSLHFDRQ